MSNTRPDFQFLQQSIPELESFLVSPGLYRVLSGSSQRLSMGALLLAIRRLTISPDPSAAMLLEQVDLAREHWLAHWREKCVAEFSARLHLWVNYLAEYRQDPQGECRAYPRQVEWRAMLELLGEDTPPSTADQVQLDSLDGLLRSDFKPGNFAWDQELSPAFTQDRFWFLYGGLPPCLP